MRVLCTLLIAAAVGCSSAKKRPEDAPRLSELRGKSIAVVETTGEKTGQKIAEVALINQVQKRGTFLLVGKRDVEKARTHYQQDPKDWAGVAKRAGADYALRIRVDEFRSDLKEGYSREKVYDETLAHERGEDHGQVDKLYKVKSLSGNVKFHLIFTELQSGKTQKDYASAAKRIVKDERRGAARFPPRLRFLEELSNTAFEDFFKRNL